MDKTQKRTVNTFYAEYRNTEIPVTLHLPGNQFYRILARKNVDIYSRNFSFTFLRDHVFYLDIATTIEIRTSPTNTSSPDKFFIFVIGFTEITGHDTAFRNFAYSPGVVTWNDASIFCSFPNGYYVKPGHNNFHTLLLYELILLRVSSNDPAVYSPTNRINYIQMFDDSSNSAYVIHNKNIERESLTENQFQTPMFHWKAANSREALIIDDIMSWRVFGDTTIANTYVQPVIFYGSI